MPPRKPAGSVRASGIANWTSGRRAAIVRALEVAPRLGVAWDVFGTGKTAVRGGLGLFYARERLSVGLALGTNPPFSGTAAVTRTLNSNQPLTGGGNAGFGAPSAGITQEAGNSHNWQWNISFQHEIIRNTTVEVGYVGNRGRDLLKTHDENQVLSGDSNANGVDDRVEYARLGNAIAIVRPYGS